MPRRTNFTVCWGWVGCPESRDPPLGALEVTVIILGYLTAIQTAENSHAVIPCDVVSNCCNEDKAVHGDHRNLGIGWVGKPTW